MEQLNKMSDYAERLKLKNREHDLKMTRHRQEAKAEAERLAGIMISEIPEIRQIWGFGSVFESRRPFSETSDIDLALEGGNILTAHKIAERSSFKVDLVDITEKDDRFASLIREYGTALV